MSGIGSSSEARIRAEVADFLSSHHAKGFAPTERTGAAAVARAFLEVCYGDLGVRPDLLDGEHLREALLDVLPRRLDPGAAASKDAPRIVKALLDHFLEQHPNAGAWDHEAVFDVARENFAERLQRGGGREARADDPEPLRRPGSKLGRNDPCPCGSGKKWKKCCGKES